MSKSIAVFILLLSFFFCFNFSLAQGSVCADLSGGNGADPFCSITGVVFPNCNISNGNCTSSAEFGPDYGCLFSQPFPAWYFLQIDDPGTLNFRISQSANEDGTGAQLDVDFICYGPFSDPVSPCTAQLTAANTVDCSFLSDSVEVMNIPAALAGEYYLVLITNFSEEPGFISFQQTSGSGSTDCSILEATLGPNQNLCGFDPVLLDGTADEAVRYEWSVFNETTMDFEAILGETSAMFTVTITGRYQLLLEDIDGDIETDEILITFNEPPMITNTPMDLSVCGDGSGIGTFNLTVTAQDVLNLNDEDLSNDLSISDFDIDYYESMQDAELGNTNTISSPSIYQNEQVFNQMVYIRVDPLGFDNDCFTVIPVQLIVNTLPSFALEEQYVLRLDNDGVIINLIPTDMIDTSLDNTMYDFQWFVGATATTGNEIPGEVEASYSPVIAGTYTVLVTNNQTVCSSVVTTTVVESFPPQEEDFAVALSSGAFTDRATIEVTAGPNAIGEYEYRLDAGDWQSSPVFTGVSRGEYFVYIRDVFMCGEIEFSVEFMIDYPRYFTPNGDGFHETWGIVSNNNFQVTRILIFDRFGKLLKDLGPSGVWNGTYNGNRLPSSEYWFKVRYTENGIMKEFKSNFSLIR